MKRILILRDRQRLRALFMATLMPFSLTQFLAADNRPTGLMTDLVEHTDRTWNNGIPTGLPVWRTGEAIETLQYAAVRSSRPLFGWVVPDGGKGTLQTAYRIIVADNPTDALACRGNVWDSGRVESSQSVSVLYGGKDLQPDRCYYWRVMTVTNTGGDSQWSAMKAFRTATELQEYASTAYPLEMSVDFPRKMNAVSKGISLADFGLDAFGRPMLTVSTDGEADTLVIHLGERLDGGHVSRRSGGSTIRYRRCVLPLMQGTHTYRVKVEKDRRNTGGQAVLMPGYVGEVLPFRYCEVEGLSSSVRLQALWRETVHHPFNNHATCFQSSDTVLNRIWELCRYSIQATSFAGVYVDGDRERIPYEADALINQLCHYAVDREYTMARRTYEYLLQHPTWPTEWILQAALIAWNDYLHTADSRALAATYEQLRPRTLLALREENGLISTTTGLQTPQFLTSIRMKSPIRDIVDWPHTKAGSKLWDVPGESDGFVFTDYNSVTNAFHYAALCRMSLIAGVLGKTDDQTFYQAEADKLKKRYVQAFFDHHRGCFTDGLVSADTVHSSLHANMMALAFGLAPQKEYKRILQFMHGRGMACSVYGAQFLLDALYEAGDADYALRLLTATDDRSWYNMLRTGSTITTEAWDNKYKTNQDWNHAWGAVPGNIIPRRLMGVEPLTPGFGTIRVKPMTATLEQAKTCIPTIRGTVGVSVTNRGGIYRLTVDIPANMEAEVYLPLPKGRYRVSLDGCSVDVKRVKGEDFLYAGKVGSGTYTWEVVR